MKSWILALVVALPLGLTVGCNKDSGSSSASNSPAGTPIAMVDPDRVAAAVGWAADAQKNLEASQTEVRRQIDAHIAPTRAAFERKKAEIFQAAKLSPMQIESLNTRRTTRTEMEKMGLTVQQIDELLQAGAAWQNDVTAGQNGLQQAMSQQGARIQSAYRDVLNPIIRRVAHDKGRAVVFLPQQAAYFDPSVDLTDDVIKEIQKGSVKFNLPDMPRIEFSATQPVGSPTTSPIVPTTMPTAVPTTQPH